MPSFSFVFGALVIAFIVFITMKGELPQYMQVFGL